MNKQPENQAQKKPMNPKVEIVAQVLRLETLCDALRLITADANAKQAGTTAHLLAFLLGCSPAKNQKELAARLGVSRARVCQMIKTLNRGLPQFPLKGAIKVDSR
jgi:hypothetical protein